MRKDCGRNSKATSGLKSYSWGVDGFGYRHVYDENSSDRVVIACCKGHPIWLIEQLKEQDN